MSHDLIFHAGYFCSDWLLRAVCCLISISSSYPTRTMPKRGQRKSLEISTPNSDLDGEFVDDEPRRFVTAEELLDELSPVTDRKTSKRHYVSPALSSNSETKKAPIRVVCCFKRVSSKKFSSKRQRRIIPAKQTVPKQKISKTPQSCSPADTPRTTPFVVDFIIIYSQRFVSCLRCVWISE